MDMYMKSRAEGFGAEVKRRILIGTYVLSAGYYDAYYLKAQQIRRLIADDFTQAFKQCDVIMGPTAPSTAFKAGEKADDPVAMYLQDVYTIATNLAQASADAYSKTRLFSSAIMKAHAYAKASPASPQCLRLPSATAIFRRASLPSPSTPSPNNLFRATNCRIFLSTQLVAL